MHPAPICKSVMKNRFTKKLLKWYSANPREMPWKHTNDPYKIWLSEIILQQTRVEQGLPYYERMIKRFPTVNHLAKASEAEVLKSWEGLGYYTRARNLHAAAKQIILEFNGKFPETHETILQLKGVGPYSAAAIGSFAFGLPHAVVDGNVYRVLARYFGIRETVDVSKGKKIFSDLAQKLMDKKNPGDYNQAIMNFGALVCKPANPECFSCIFKKECVAYLEQSVAELPAKARKNVVRNRWFNFLVLENEEDVIIEKRNEKDIWNSLYQFPLLEARGLLKPSELKKLWKKENFFGDQTLKTTSISEVITHKLSHQTIFARFVHLQLDSQQLSLPDGWMKVKKKKLGKYSFPKLIDNYLKVLLF